MIFITSIFKKKTSDQFLQQCERRRYYSLKVLIKPEECWLPPGDLCQQYLSCRNCLLLHVVRELEGENTNDVTTKTVKEEMDIDILEEALDRTHRVGNPKVCKESKSRPIIIKFARYDVRSAVYKNKKKLKGKSFLIMESLTAKRVGLLKEAQGKYGVRNVWTTDGRILYKENRVFLYKK